jgi:hypothetical protein
VQRRLTFEHGHAVPLDGDRAGGPPDRGRPVGRGHPLTDPQCVTGHPARLQDGQAEVRIQIQRHAQVAWLALDHRPDHIFHELDRITEADRVRGDQVEPDMQHDSTLAAALRD